MTFAGCGVALLQRSDVNTGVLVLGLTGLFGAFLLAYGLLRWRQPGAPGKALVATGVTYFVIQMISYLLNDLDEVKLYHNQVMFMVAIPGMLLLIRADKSSREELLQLAYRVSAAVVYISVVLAVVAPTVAFGSRLGDERRWQVFGLENRLSGITPHQNLLAVTAIICILLALHLRSKWWPLTIFVCVVAIALSEARNAALTAIAVLVLYWLINGKLSPQRLVVAAAGGLLVYYLATNVLTGDASDLTAGVDNLNNRSEIWDAVTAAWGQHYFFGWGPTSFVVGSGAPFSTLGYYNAHNQFFEAIAEGGLFGLLAMTVFLVVLAAIAWRNRHEALYICLLVAMLASSLTEVFFTVHQYGISYAAIPAFLVLIVFNAGTRPSENRNDQHSDTPPDSGVQDVLRVPVRSTRP
ncbi:MAG: O-antigen ligase family protein, partial [Rhodococcus sp. (in: high G+C Gram-positive bacteria)]